MSAAVDGLALAEPGGVLAVASAPGEPAVASEHPPSVTSRSPPTMDDAMDVVVAIAG
ncbi:MAG: hypothetical protein ACFCVF_03950 [Kineosporiaceae bacterium]